MNIPKPTHHGNMWRIYVTVDGKRYPVTDKDPDVCQAKAALLKSGLQAPGTDSTRTLTQAIDCYIDRKSNILSPSTIRGYRIVQRNRFQDLMNKPVKKITRSMLEAAVNRDSETCSPKTIKNAIGLICTVISYETGNRMVVSSPAVSVNEHPYLTPDQLPFFMDAITDTDIEIPCLLGLWSLRRSEMLGLRWRDIDMKHRTIHVSGAYVPGPDNQFIRKDTAKNKTSQRVVPMCARLYDLLLPLSKKADPDDLILTINPETLRKRVNALCDSIGLPAIGVHGLRHSFVSIGYMSGVPEDVLMEIGGWANDATIKRHYLHISQQDKSRYANSMLDKFSSL